MTPQWFLADLLDANSFTGSPGGESGGVGSQEEREVMSLVWDMCSSRHPRVIEVQMSGGQVEVLVQERELAWT